MSKTDQLVFSDRSSFTPAAAIRANVAIGLDKSISSNALLIAQYL